MHVHVICRRENLASFQANAARAGLLIWQRRWLLLHFVKPTPKASTRQSAYYNERGGRGGAEHLSGTLRHEQKLTAALYEYIVPRYLV